MLSSVLRCACTKAHVLNEKEKKNVDRLECCKVNWKKKSTATEYAIRMKADVRSFNVLKVRMVILWRRRK